MPTLNELYPSKYVKASDLTGDTVVTIKAMKLESMKAKDGTEKSKPVLYLAETKPLVLNVTNARAIETLHGSNTDNWIGKSITLYTAEVAAFGETGPAIRVRNAQWMIEHNPNASAPSQLQNGNGTDKAAAIKAWNDAAIRAKSLKLLDVVESLRPAKDADAATILKAAHDVQYQADIFEGKQAEEMA